MGKTVGIDVGNYSIKLIELEEKRKSIELTKCGFARIINKDVLTALKGLVADHKLAKKKVNISLAGLSVIVRYIEMPSMNKEELKSSIKYEAEKYIPFNIKESIIDCAMLDKSNTGQQRVILVAVKKNEVEELLQVFTSADLDVNIVDIDSFAFFNSFQRLNIEGNDKSNCALINLGSKLSNMNIVSNGNVFFTRDILWGGTDITNRIKDSFNISFEEAERIKEEIGDKKEALSNAITPVLERLTLQIRMSFDYFESQFGKTVDALYISGGTSYLFNIVDFFKSSLGIDTFMWNPLEGVKISEGVDQKTIQSMPSLYAVALGLALRK